MAARKIKLKDQLGRVISVPVATPPATPVTPPVTQPETPRPIATVWKLIREIPANIQKLAKLLGTGFTTRGPDGEWFQRQIEAGEGIDVADGDGVAGNPTIGLAELANAGGGTLQKTLRDDYGRLAGTSAATTSDLAEGGNLYFTDERADARAAAAVSAHVAASDPHTQYFLKPTGSNAEFLRGDGTSSSSVGTGLVYLEATKAVGIGTLSPAYQLHIEGISAGIRIDRLHATQLPFMQFIRGGDITVGFQLRGMTAGCSITSADSATNFAQITSTYVRPGVDNAQTLGGASYRWTTVYAATGTINTSDAREKTAVRPFTPAELAAAAELGREIGVYQWLAMLAEKGDAARQHIGLTVQRAIEVMESHGLDPFARGFICYDEWDELPEVVGEEGEIEQAFRPAGDRYSFRMDELLAFIIAGERAARQAGEQAMAAKIEDLLQRLAAAGL